MTHGRVQAAVAAGSVAAVIRVQPFGVPAQGAGLAVLSYGLSLAYGRLAPRDQEDALDVWLAGESRAHQLATGSESAAAAPPADS